MTRQMRWVAAVFLLTAGIAEAQTTLYFKRDHVYAGPGGGEIAIITPAPSDTAAPGVPTGVGTSSVTATSVVVSWTGSTDSGGSLLAGYKVYRQKGSGASLPVGTVASGTTTFTDQPLEPSTSYSWTVRAFDNAQNHSAAGSGANATTLASSTDSTPPSKPLQLTGRAVASTTVHLNWLTASDLGGSGIAGYMVKRGGTDISGWLSATTLSYVDSSAPQNATSTYTVTAKDGNGNSDTTGSPPLSVSDSINVMTPLDSEPPTTPGSPGATALGSTSIRRGNAVETIVRIQMRGQSSNGQPVTISASLTGNDANSLRVDYGRPVAKSFINTPQGAVEVTTGGKTVWKPAHVGAFAQLDILSVIGIQHLATPLVQRTVRGAEVVEGRVSVRVGALTERTKKVFRRTVPDGVDVLVDQASGVVVEIIRRQLAENNLDASFLAGFRFSNYSTVQGIVLPYRIQRVINGTVVETITLDTIDLNPPLTSTFFKAPANHTTPRVIGRRP